MTKYLVTYKSGKREILDDTNPPDAHRLRILRQDARMSEGMRGVMNASDAESVRKAK